MRQLTLTNDQFDALYSYLQETVEYLEGDLVTTEDENGNEILEDKRAYSPEEYAEFLSLLGGN